MNNVLYFLLFILLFSSFQVFAQDCHPLAQVMPLANSGNIENLIKSTKKVSEQLLNEGLDKATNKAFSLKIKQQYKKALACKPLETDPKTNLNIKTWMALKPETPHWKSLLKIQSVGQDAIKASEKVSGSDKVKHCFVGCYISSKLDYYSGVMAGWFKEVVDASDCSPQTHFEKGDYDATHAGAFAGRSKSDCSAFCQRKDVSPLNGEEMLTLARREFSK